MYIEKLVIQNIRKNYKMTWSVIIFPVQDGEDYPNTRQVLQMKRGVIYYPHVHAAAVACPAPDNSDEIIWLSL